MNPDKQNQTERENTALPYPTSPWTELYQSMPSQQAERAAFDSEDQRPTHDALSNIYNRE